MKSVLGKLPVEYHSFLKVLLHSFPKSCSYSAESHPREKPPIGKTSLVESFFRKIAGIDSRPATLLKRSFHHRCFPEIHRNFTASSERSNVCSILNKIVGCDLQGLNFVKMLVHLRQLVLGTYSQEKICSEVCL